MGSPVLKDFLCGNSLVRSIDMRASASSLLRCRVGARWLLVAKLQKNDSIIMSGTTSVGGLNGSYAILSMTAYYLTVKEEAMVVAYLTLRPPAAAG